MKIAYFDCFSGISGDMCLGAFVDAGLPFGTLTKALATLKLAGYSLRRRRVTRGALSATKVDIIIEAGADRPMSLRDIQKLLRTARLPQPVRARSLAVFQRLGEAEAAVHATSVRNVHFHELGVIDSLVDVVGTVWACHLLGIEAIYASAINLGAGTIRGEHGLMPVPAPATANIMTGLTVYAAGPSRELTTPTGAALIATLAAGVGTMPPMSISAVGYGAGAFNPPDWANALRLFLGETVSTAESDRIMVLETNLDDMNPQAYELLMERLLAQGALDATLTPVIMKRGRPGVVLTVLADPGKLVVGRKVVFAETTTLGVRVQEVARRVLAREITEVATKFGLVRVKVAQVPKGGPLKASPEYRDCKRIAEQTGLPLRRVMQDVERALRRIS